MPCWLSNKPFTDDYEASHAVAFEAEALLQHLTSDSCPQVAEQCEALDLEHKCALYWQGKADRAAQLYADSVPQDALHANASEAMQSPTKHAEASKREHAGTYASNKKLFKKLFKESFGYVK